MFRNATWPLALITLVAVSAGCDSTPRISAPAVDTTPSEARRIVMPKGDLIILGDEVSIAGKPGSIKLPAVLRQQLRTIDSLHRTFRQLEVRLNADHRLTHIRNRYSGVPESAAHAALASGVSADASTISNCNDIALAIYYGTQSYRGAMQRYDNFFAEYAFDAIVNQLFSGDPMELLPTPADLGRLASLAAEIVIRRTALDILATQYSANGCWD